jgi:hypothetical protein
MRLVDKISKVSRRDFLAASGAAAITISGSALLNPGEAWGMMVKNLKPASMRTLIQMARDIYPHDSFGDKIYAEAMKGYDDEAGADAGAKKLLEDGVALLDSKAKAKHGTGYIDVGWESDRVAILKEIEGDAFFQKIRGGLVTGIYNNKVVWAKLGYEGASFPKGGYLERGFDDISWL